MPDEKDIYEGMPMEEQIILGEQIKLLWGFMLQLKPHRDLMERMAQDAEERASFAVSAAVLNPFGFEAVEAKHNRVAKRARLLVQLLDCLEETDRVVTEAERGMAQREDIARKMGML